MADSSTIDIAFPIDVLDWPNHVLSALSAEERDRLVWNMGQCGLAVCTDFSGIDAPREAMDQTVVAIQKYFEENEPGTSFTPNIEWFRSCDVGVVQSQ
eukprot:1582418-Pyramimonas_sp.AAC.1